MIEKKNNISKKWFLRIYMISMLIFLFSCSRENNENSLRNQTINELVLPATINFSETDTSIREYLSEELTKQLNELNKNQIQDHSKIKYNYQDKWNIGYKIKSEKDFDIMVVEQLGEAKIKCLITISKKNPIRIISSIIVALDNYQEKKGILESENWTSEISSDLKVKVKKHYEKIVDENEVSKPGLNVVNNHDLYKILPDGTIENISKNDGNKKDSIMSSKYDVVIIFMNKLADEAPQLSEDWLLFNTEIENFCNSSDIQVQYCYDNFEQVSIVNSKKKTVAKLNIKKYSQQYNSGYILASDDSPMIYIPYGPSDVTIKYIKQYFKLSLE